MANDQKSPSEIEKDIESERAALSDTLNDLQDRFSVDGLVRQAGDQLRTNGAQVGDTISRAVRENPIALAVTGVGLAWLIFGSGQSGGRSGGSTGGRNLPVPFSGDDDDDFGDPAPGWAGDPYELRRGRRRSLYAGTEGDLAYDVPDWAQSDRYGDDDWESEDGAPLGQRLAETSHKMQSRADEAAADLRARAGSAKSDMRRTGHDAKEGARRRWEGAKGAASERSERARARMRRMQDQLSRGTEDLSEEARLRVVRARRRAMEAREQARHYARRGVDRGNEFFEEQPLLAGALALAVGAAFGAALPRSRMEDNSFGRESDRLMSEAEAVYYRERDKARRVAERARDEAQAAIDETEAEADKKAPGDKNAAEAGVEAAADRAKKTGQRVAEAASDEADKQNLGRPAG